MRPPRATTIRLSPSLICLDLCNLEREVRKLERAGIDLLHIDLLDGHFSPSLPIGIDTVRQLREKTHLPFDIHLMVTDNEFFVRELLTLKPERLCFHFESTRHVDRLLGMIQGAGVGAGIALTPATPPAVLEYVIDRLDFVLLMLINPGFAGHQGETQVPYAVRKVAACRKFLDRHRRGVGITADGRVSLATIPKLVAAGADVLVAGTSCLFSPAAPFLENLRQTRNAIGAGLKRSKGAGTA